MKDIFGEIDPSPELDLYELMPEVDDYDTALALYKSYLNDDMPVAEAMNLTKAEVMPLEGSSFSGDQS